MRKERGFTLIELLIVLAILAILIGIVALSVGNLRRTAMERGMQSERETVETALNAYVTLASPLVNVPNQITLTKVTTAQAWGQYLKRDTKYYYTWTGVGTAGQKVIVWDATSPAICCDMTACGDVTVASSVGTCVVGSVTYTGTVP